MCGLAVSLAHVDDPEVPAHRERDDLVRVHPDVPDLLVRDTLVERPRRYVLLCVGVPCKARIESYGKERRNYAHTT